ncbi:hypothetical protein QJS04_geneDACA018755 [Acorus gramineus]|uniref:Zinc finger PHD-type domain-containing protein n=1 Tax=Acorus gramineus TaxID=55184 RepID=A0AAV9AEB8_ACOGR|nr:hypothetical protein QJS04_geneDACA018755 [Acorus gramineus]
MAEVPSPTSLAWYWVIEALADLKDVHSSLLKDLIDRVPGFLSGSSDAARERVGLRCLEEWVDMDPGPVDSRPCLDEPSTSAAVVEVLGRPIEVGSRCENVLSRLVKKVAAPSTSRKYGTEHSKNDFCQFILQKRASLPRCFLDRLKESIPDNCDIVGQVLNEHSSLTKRNRVGYLDSDLILPDSEDEHVRPKKLKWITTDGRTELSKQNSAALTSGSRNEIFLDDIPVYRKECANINTSTSDRLKDSRNDKYSAKALSVKQKSVSNTSITKAKKIHNAQEKERRCTAEPFSQESVHIDEVEFVSDPNHIVEVSSKQHGCPDAAPNDILETDIINAEKDKFLSSQNIFSQQSLMEDLTQQKVCIKCNDGGPLLNCSSSGCPVVVHENCWGLSIELKDIECYYCPFCTCSRAAVAYRKAKREAFLARKSLSSFIDRHEKQGHHKKQQIYEVPSELTQNRHKGLSLTINVHKCVGATEEQPQRGSVIDCRNDTVADISERPFFGSRNDDALSQGKRNCAKNIQDCQCSSAVQHQQQNGDVIKCNNVNSPCIKIDWPATNGKCDETLIKKEVVLNDGFESTIVEKQPQEADDDTSFHSCPDNLREVNSALSNGTHDHFEGAENSEKLQSFVGSKHQDFGGDHERGSSSLGEEISQDYLRVSQRKSKYAAECQTSDLVGNVEKQTKDNSSSGKRRIRPGKRYANPLHLGGRRNKLCWTQEEEEMLRARTVFKLMQEAVQKFANSNVKGTPWTRILDYGFNVFHRTRVPGDLKDKWRNITIKEGLKKES